MKQQVSITESGVQVENTFSMALQNHHRHRKKFLLLLVAFVGVFSSIFTFLSMFSPAYSLPVLIAVMLGLFIFFSYCAMRPRSGFVPILIIGIVYCGLFFWKRQCISSGLMYFTNMLCQTIYQTDWQYFTMDHDYSEITSVTWVLCFLVFPIIWMLCFAVLRYQNFFLSLLATFPFVEIGLFFGIVPNHGFMLSLVAFWFAIMAIQLASSGITRASKTGFLRRKNTFFPVSHMRFMLSEDTGIAMLSIVIILLLLSEFLLHINHYERPENIKQLRTNFQNYVASLHLSDETILDDYGTSYTGYDDNQELINLGTVDEKIFEEIPVTSIAFSENPNSRIYLKYRTGHVYNGTNWTILPEEIYQDNLQENIANAFQELNYYPEEFLYYTAPELHDIQLSLYHATGILEKCIPYGFMKNENISCNLSLITTNTSNYSITGGADYEQIFMNPDSVSYIKIASLLMHTNRVDLFSELLQNDNSVWLPKSNQLNMLYYGDNAFSEQASQAGILCGSGYSDFVYEQETYLPDTADMQVIKNTYADLFENFNAKTASPSEIIAKLQQIREKICNEVSYTLAPGKTPANQDHVSYFLLKNKKGYCEHYATAGTVLARMAGIPARYCEGYMIDCSRNVLNQTELEGNIAYVSEILDSNAHAWTEIYLNGIGWIPFEFTFSYFSEPSKITENIIISEITESKFEPVISTTNSVSTQESTETTEGTIPETVK
ncbi:MAG: transglutaminase-like domain-containing protein, partial [Oscillospiraceae bacterium]|nr:transglutaminase-like domain-containing protein [Oscillospiraceae bacterium]